MYSVHCLLFSASCVACVSERPIIWQSSKMLSVQHFLGHPRCPFPWTRPYRAWCGHRKGCILTTMFKVSKMAASDPVHNVMLYVELILDVCISDVRRSWHIIVNNGMSKGIFTLRMNNAWHVTIRICPHTRICTANKKCQQRCTAHRPFTNEHVHSRGCIAFFYRCIIAQMLLTPSWQRVT